MNKGFQLFGTKVLVTIRGQDDSDTVSSSIYVPKQLTGVITNYPDTLFSQSGTAATVGAG